MRRYFGLFNHIFLHYVHVLLTYGFIVVYVRLIVNSRLFTLQSLVNNYLICHGDGRAMAHRYESNTGIVQPRLHRHLEGNSQPKWYHSDYVPVILVFIIIKFNCSAEPTDTLHLVFVFIPYIQHTHVYSGH